MTKALEILGKTLFPATNGNIAKFLKDNDTFSITVNMTVEAMEEYGKYCAEEAWKEAIQQYATLSLSNMVNGEFKMKSPEEWWLEFQKEATE